MVQGARAATRHPASQLGQREAEFTGECGVVNLSPLVMGAVDRRLDGGHTG